MREKAPQAPTAQELSINALNTTIDAYLYMEEGADLRYGIRNIGHDSLLNGTDRRQLKILALWIYGRDFQGFLDSADGEMGVAYQNTIKAALENERLIPRVAKLDLDIRKFRLPSNVGLREKEIEKERLEQELLKEPLVKARIKKEENSIRTKAAAKARRNRQDEILRGDSQPLAKGKRNAMLFMSNAEIIERLDSFGIRNPRQISQMLGRKEGYIGYVRHRLIRAGRIERTPRVSNFRPARDREAETRARVDKLICNGLENKEIVKLVTCSLSTVERRRKVLANQTKAA